MESLWQFWMNWGIQFAIGLGTIGAVVVALFGEWLRTYFMPPDLRISFENPRGASSPCVVGLPDGSTRASDSRWYHITVQNRRRLSPVRQTQILMLNIEEPDASGSNRTIWSGAMPLKWRSVGYLPEGRTIGYPAECDLCSVIKDGFFELHPAVVEFSMNAQRDKAFRYCVTLQARGVEADSNLLRVEISWDGQWVDGQEEMARHLVLKVVG